ncbi:ribonuclease HII [Geothermobacter hydrogeniphilus]|uniref:Ribonuclease HII n=1 Tax=Geothermobacter hydrogeniphilus TaxID=1969733 RepID=A0A1X0YB73_9BACT|nr:ribonuclease HII [Geothermobacter hydrogeniphilus]PNU20048.1 ribonuclease HII [Geothermobacter hydrogeniphilus]
MEGFVTLDLFPVDAPTDLYFEQQARSRGYRVIAGIDEAGRGPLAGPVVAAAVVLPERFDLPGLTDSKKLTARKRAELFLQIRSQAAAVGVGIMPAEEVDRRNILQATLAAMRLAVERLRCPADYLLVDGISRIPTTIPQLTLKKGDSRSLSVAAASVIAKVVRDRMMCAYDRRYPQYGFAGHKGYGSAAHRRAIAEHGPCPLHRRTFGGVREHLERS